MKKRYHGEEATKISRAEHDRIMKPFLDGTKNILDCMVEPPAASPRFLAMRAEVPPPRSPLSAKEIGRLSAGEAAELVAHLNARVGDFRADRLDTRTEDEKRIDARMAREDAIARGDRKPRATVKFNANPRACYVCNGTVRKNTGHCWEGLDGEPDRYAHDKCYREDCGD